MAAAASGLSATHSCASSSAWTSAAATGFSWRIRLPRTPSTQQVRWANSPVRLLATSVRPSRSRAIQPSGSPWQKAWISPFFSATGRMSPGNTFHSTSLLGSMPAWWSMIEKKLRSGAARSVMPIVLPLRSEILVMPLPGAENRRMQPPWIPAAILTSKPPSRGFSQRSAMPTPASALPVAMASSSWSVDPPKLISSTSRLCRAKWPFSFATATPTVQMAVAFQVSFSARFSGRTTGAPNEARQITGSRRSVGRLPMKTRWAKTLAGTSVPVTAVARRNVRRVGRRNIAGTPGNAERAVERRA